MAKGLKYAESVSLGRDRYNDVWKDITDTLNSAGLPTRTTVEWQKVLYLGKYQGMAIYLNVRSFQVWSDLKLKVRQKLQHNKKEVNATGGGPNRLKTLSPYEEAVVDLLSLDKLTDHAG